MSRSGHVLSSVVALHASPRAKYEAAAEVAARKADGAAEAMLDIADCAVDAIL